MGILGKEGGVEESVGGLGNRLFLKSSLAANLPQEDSGWACGMEGKWKRKREESER